MIVEKKINNNVALCVDKDGNEVIVFSKGVGFKPTPYEITDLSVIEKSFYNIKSEHVRLLTDISDDVLEAATKILKYVENELSGNINENLFFTLADHIQFVLKRAREGIYIHMGIGYITRADYPTEMRIAEKIVRYLNRKFSIQLTNEEASFIAIHIIEAETNIRVSEEREKNEKLIGDCVEVIEKHYQIHIERDSFNYSRFLMHMKNLLSRQKNQTLFNSDNGKIFEQIREEYEEAYTCALEIQSIFKERLKTTLLDDEMLYLIIHINRLCTKELD